MESPQTDNAYLKRIDKNLARLLAIFEYLHRDICDELDRKDIR